MSDDVELVKNLASRAVEAQGRAVVVEAEARAAEARASLWGYSPHERVERAVAAAKLRSEASKARDEVTQAEMDVRVVVDAAARRAMEESTSRAHGPISVDPEGVPESGRGRAPEMKNFLRVNAIAKRSLGDRWKP